MGKIEGLIELLGEDNAKRIKDSVTVFIIDAVMDDFNDCSRENYILNPEEIIDFVDECKEEAFSRIKEDVVNHMAEKIKATINNNDVRSML